MMTNLYTFLQNDTAELFGDTLKETGDTQMCRDTQFENHCHIPMY